MNNQGRHIGKRKRQDNHISNSFNFTPSLPTIQNTQTVDIFRFGLTKPDDESTRHIQAKSTSTFLSLTKTKATPNQITQEHVHYQSEQQNQHPSENYWRHAYYSMTVLTYVQTLFNCIIIGLVIYIITQMIINIRTDFILKAKEHSRVLLQEIESCQRNYRINQCDPTTRVPALESSCNRWESCMERDEREIARTKVSAETIAEIINSFMEPISYKALIFFTIFTIGSLVFSNITFGLFQKRHREDPGYQQHIQRITHSHTSKSAS